MHAHVHEHVHAEHGKHGEHEHSDCVCCDDENAETAEMSEPWGIFGAGSGENHIRTLLLQAGNCRIVCLDFGNQIKFEKT